MIIIFGSNGMLGSYIYKKLQQLGHTIITIERKDFDINENISFDSINMILQNTNYGDVIINCAGIIPQRHNDPHMFFRVNTVFPIILSSIAEIRGLNMIHISTDCVFDGKKGAYTENDFPTEQGLYGLSKAMGDYAKACIIRTSIIGEDIGNYSFLGFCRKNKGHNIQGYANHFWNGVTCLQLAYVIDNIIQNNKYWKGVRHIFSPMIVSKYELAQIINKSYNLQLDIQPIQTSELVDKTLSTVFCTNNLFDIPPIDIQIQDMYEFSQQ